jgi:hypothetical protein
MSNNGSRLSHFDIEVLLKAFVCAANIFVPPECERVSKCPLFDPGEQVLLRLAGISLRQELYF